MVETYNLVSGRFFHPTLQDLPEMRPMAQVLIDATHSLHDNAGIDFTIHSTLSQAAGNLYFAFKQVLPERLAKALSMEFAQEIEELPETVDAASNQMFVLHFKSVQDDTAPPLMISGGITRLIALPFGGNQSPRANLGPARAGQFCDDWAQNALLFTAFTTGEQPVDHDENARLLTDAQMMRLQLLQMRMKAQAQAATAEDMTAQVGLLTTLGALLGAYKQVAAKKSQEVADKDELARLNGAIRNNSRDLIDVLLRDSMKMPNMSSSLLAAVKELRAIGVMAEKSPPRIKVASGVQARSATFLDRARTSSIVVPARRVWPAAMMPGQQNSFRSGPSAATRTYTASPGQFINARSHSTPAYTAEPQVVRHHEVPARAKSQSEQPTVRQDEVPARVTNDKNTSPAPAEPNSVENSAEKARIEAKQPLQQVEVLEAGQIFVKSETGELPVARTRDVPMPIVVAQADNALSNPPPARQGPGDNGGGGGIRTESSQPPQPSEGQKIHEIPPKTGRSELQHEHPNDASPPVVADKKDDKIKEEAKQNDTGEREVVRERLETSPGHEEKKLDIRADFDQAAEQAASYDKDLKETNRAISALKQELGAGYKKSEEYKVLRERRDEIMAHQAVQAEKDIKEGKKAARPAKSCGGDCSKCPSPC
jgi:hypothetical protein